jgi:hypothetical protein
MKVGTIVKLKVDCLGNPAGTLGVVFYHYGDGVQAIFKNGNYDGFSLTSEINGMPETEYFLEPVSFAPWLADYQFQSVMKVSWDFSSGVFDKVWEEQTA